MSMTQPSGSTSPAPTTSGDRDTSRAGQPIHVDSLGAAIHAWRWPEDAAGRRVVVIGSGFGGLETVKALARAPVEIVVIDRHNFHCFQPLLYQVATAALSPADIAWPIRDILQGQENVTVLMAEVTGIDAADKTVHTRHLRIDYDWLVIATGATHSYFGHDDWEPFAPGLKSIEDATAIRRKVLSAFEIAELMQEGPERRALLTYVIVGAGPTGVELAGSIAEMARHTLPPDFRDIPPSASRICLIEAGPRILPSFPEHLGDYAGKALENLGVEVMTGTPVTGCDADGVVVGDRRIDARTVLWAAGVVASPAAKWLGAEHDRAGRIVVAGDCSIPGVPDAFAVGDTASFIEEDGKPVPGLAPAAKQMGKFVGKLIAARLSGDTQPRTFRYRNEGDLATVGRSAAVVKLGRFEFTGFLAWVFWCVVHVYFLIGIRNRLIVAATWVWSYITRKRGARLITGGS